MMSSQPKNASRRKAAAKAMDSDPDLVKIMGKTGYTVYGWFSGNTKMEMNSGTTVTGLRGGAKITRLKDGSTITEFKDGSTMTEVGGLSIITYPDGTVTTDYKNGMTSKKYKDGTIVVKSSDGSTMATYPDGTTVSSSNGGHVVTTYPDGRRIISRPDGNKVIEDVDGTVTIRHPDGTKELRQAHPSNAQPLKLLPKSPRSQSDTKRGARHLGLSLPVGHLALCPERVTSIGMVEGTSVVSPGSFVVCAETGADGAVLNLYDTSHDGVVVTIAGQKVSLPPGHEIVMTNKVGADFDAVNPFPEVAYRHVTEHLVTPEIKVFIAEFSIPCAVTAIEPIRRLFYSQRKEDRQLSNIILKTAAGMSLLKRDSEPFRRSGLTVRPSGPAT
jgi:hypothetical protein